MSPTFEASGVRLFLGDCREIAPALTGVDAVITDPPYGLGIAANPVRQMHAKSDWDNAPPLKRDINAMRSWAETVVIWGGNYFDLPPCKGFLIWDKYQPAEFSLAMCEMAWTTRDAPAKLFRKSVLSYPKDHPTQKPVELMGWCMEQAKVPAGATVLDPYMGSGTTGIACIRTGRNFIGIELDPAHFKTAQERIERELAQGVLAI